MDIIGLLKELSGVNDVTAFAQDPTDRKKALMAMLALGSVIPVGRAFSTVGKIDDLALNWRNLPTDPKRRAGEQLLRDLHAGADSLDRQGDIPFHMMTRNEALAAPGTMAHGVKGHKLGGTNRQTLHVGTPLAAAHFAPDFIPHRLNIKLDELLPSLHGKEWDDIYGLPHGSVTDDVVWDGSTNKYLGDFLDTDTHEVRRIPIASDYEQHGPEQAFETLQEAYAPRGSSMYDTLQGVTANKNPKARTQFLEWLRHHPNAPVKGDLNFADALMEGKVVQPYLNNAEHVGSMSFASLFGDKLQSHPRAIYEAALEGKEGWERGAGDYRGLARLIAQAKAGKRNDMLHARPRAYKGFYGYNFPGEPSPWITSDSFSIASPALRAKLQTNLGRRLSEAKSEIFQAAQAKLSNRGYPTNISFESALDLLRGPHSDQWERRLVERYVDLSNQMLKLSHSPF